MSARVVVTGVGVASAFGVGRGSLVAGLELGQIRAAPLAGQMACVPPGVGGQFDVPRKDWGNWFDSRVLRPATMTRQTTLGCIACGAALRDAGRHEEEIGEHPDRGAFLGSFIVPPALAKQFGAMKLLSHRPDGQPTGWILDDRRLAEAMKKASAFDFLRALPNMPSSHLSIQTGHQGPACTYLGSDSSGMQALAMAAGAIAQGTTRAMVAGGAFDPFQEVHLAWQGQRGLWTRDGQVLPYDRRRSGTVPGEGAVLLYLEDLDGAIARGATVLAEVIGFAQRFVNPGSADEVDVRAEVLRAVLPEGSPDWIGPSAIGHPLLDRLEANAWVRAFGRHGLDGTGGVTVVPQVGFTGPAAGPLNLASALLAAMGECRPARRDVDPDPDPDCAVLGATLGRQGRTGRGAIVLGSSFSLDGVHAALALRVGAAP